MPLNLLKRSEKGSALTHQEGDQNKTDAENFANALETRLDVSINADGTLKDNKVVYAATLAGSDAYAVTVSGTYATLADLAGRILLVKIDVANTGTATLNVNSLGATAIYRPGGVALRSGDLKPGVAELTLYVGGTTYFVLLNAGSNSPENYKATTNSSNDYTITIADLSSDSFEVPADYYEGYTIWAKFNATNTGSARIKVVATTPSITLAFVTIRLQGADLAGGEIQSGVNYPLVFDGTYFQLQTIRKLSKYLVIQDQKATTTEGGTFTQGAWQTRVLNTTVHNGITGASLASNQITLPAGSYRFSGWAVGHEVLNHQTRLRNVTAGTTIGLGSNVRSTASSNVGAVSTISGRFTLATSSVIELQHRCESTKATDGFGKANSFGENEVFASIDIEQE